MTKDSVYRVYFQGLKYSQPTHEVVKLSQEGLPMITYLVTAKHCNCMGFERSRGKRECRHTRLRDYYETNQRPLCFLRVSGSINIFQDPLAPHD